MNTSTDIAKERIMTQGRDFFPSITEPPIITGRSGKTHGASMVNNQATNDNINKLMVAEKILKVSYENLFSLLYNKNDRSNKEIF